MSRIGEVIVNESQYVLDLMPERLIGESVRDVVQQAEARVQYDTHQIMTIPLMHFLNLLLLHIENTEKIAAIKTLREWSGASLIDSKRMIDRIIAVGTDAERKRVMSEYGEFDNDRIGG